MRRTDYDIKVKYDLDQLEGLGKRPGSPPRGGCQVQPGVLLCKTHERSHDELEHYRQLDADIDAMLESI